MNAGDLERIRLYLAQLRDRGVDRVYRSQETPAPRAEAAAAAATGAPPRPTQPVPPRAVPPSTSARTPAESKGARHPTTRARPSVRDRVDQDSLFAEMSPLNEGNPTTRSILDAATLEGVEALASGCRRCGLCQTRNRVVFGSGNPDANLLFVGEAPGRDEDEQGLPFVGRAGKLLTKIIESIDLTRDDVYIMNVLKCRPPGNRDPEDEERERCRPFLEKQIEYVDPRIICALGAHAAHTLLGLRSVSMKVLREGVHYYGEIKVIPTYHPAALLRNPHWKGMVWEDMQTIRALLDEPEDD